MIRLKEAVIVEGKYDKIKLAGVIDGLILVTDGFGIFKDKKKMSLIRRLAATCGVVILTDSDAAGFRIRSYLSGCLRDGKVYQAYIPDILGKERRKEKASSEGKLGVEGVPTAVILEALERAGVTPAAVDAPAGTDGQASGRRTGETGGQAAGRRITKQDFYEDGLTGGADSRARRQRLMKRLDLPERLSANSLADVLNQVVSYEGYKALVAELDKEA